MHFARMSTPPRPVNAIRNICLGETASRKRGARSMPLIPGKVMSTVAQSGAKLCARTRALAPSSAISTS